MNRCQRGSWRRRSRAGGLVGLVLTLLAVLPGHPPQAQTIPLEAKIKAAYLYNFTKFVNWPEGALDDPQQPFRICILGSVPFEEHLAPLRQRSTGSHPIELRHIHQASEALDCQILYIGDQTSQTPAQVQAALGGRAILTTSSRPEFAAQGGMIGFVIHDQRVRLEMNLASTRRAGLRVNAQLVEVCVRVFESDTPAATP